MVSLGFAGRQARGTVSAGGPIIKAKGRGIRAETPAAAQLRTFEVTRR